MVKSLCFSTSGFLKSILPLLQALFLIVFPGAVSADSETQPLDAPENGLSLIEAVRDTIEKQPDVLLQKQEVITRLGELQVKSGEFDASITSAFDYTRYGTATDVYEQDVLQAADRTYITTGYSLGIQKKTRYGISFGPRVDMTRSHGVTDYLVNSSNNRSTVYFTVNLPLLKGLGRDATGAEEMAAESQLEASRLQLENTLSKNVMDTTIAYWSYLEAQMRLEIFRQMEKDSRQALEDTKLLVLGDQQPAADLDTLEADLADKISNRIAAEQSLFVARQNLGLAMGIAYGSIDSLAFPADPFPDSTHGIKQALDLNPEMLFQEALTKRGDYLAAKTQEKAARILLKSATNNLLPQLDVNAGIGYSGLSNGGNIDDYFKSLGRNIEGANYSAGVKLTFPIGNNEAEGLLLQRRSSLRKAVINTRNLERKIRSGIVVAIKAIRHAARALIEKRRSVKHYGVAVSNEKIKFTMGMASVLDVINVQNFLRDARLSEVTNRNNYAAALVNLSYQTGNLIVASGDNYQINANRLVSLPKTGSKINGGN